MVHLHPRPEARPSDEHQGQDLPLTGEAKLRKQASSASIFQQQIKIYPPLFFFFPLPLRVAKLNPCRAGRHPAELCC